MPRTDWKKLSELVRIASRQASDTFLRSVQGVRNRAYERRYAGSPLVSLVPGRLARPGHFPRLPPTVDDAEHRGVVRQAELWQQQAGSATFWEVAAFPRAGQNRAYELAGLVASAGEQLALARAAAVEVVLWADARRRMRFDAGHEMSMRGMAEAQCLFVIGAGHTLANIAIRALALETDLRCELQRRFRRSFEPFSDDKRDWQTLNLHVCRNLREVAAIGGDNAVIDEVELIAAFGTGESWDALYERRAVEFHRWRPQTHGIEGVPRSSPWSLGGTTISIQLGHRAYADARGRADETADIANRGMIDLATAMDAVGLGWSAASACLTGAPLAFQGVEPATTPGS
jgi:hypothetical protein